MTNDQAPMTNKCMTTQEMLAIPGRHARRWLIEGQLRQKPRILHDRYHSRTLARLSFWLEEWNQEQSIQKGLVIGGEAGIRLHRDPDTRLGVDLAVVSREIAERPSDLDVIEGAPTLVIEILSPDDTKRDLHEKVSAALKYGTKLFWLADPVAITITAHETGKQPVLYNRDHEVSGDPYLPGLRVPVRELLF
jgi:Uma2 family endonuclease